MTSMPASRKASANTFAPRSWPSRPGLAMRTRILRAAVMHLSPYDEQASQLVGYRITKGLHCQTPDQTLWASIHKMSGRRKGRRHMRHLRAGLGHQQNGHHIEANVDIGEPMLGH